MEYFNSKKHEVHGADLYDQPSRRYHYTKVSRLSPEFDELFERHKFDGVVNASGSANVPYSMSHPVLDFESNTLDTIRVLDAVRKHQSQIKYVHISSAAVYGNPKQLPISENDIVHPLSPYGWHKLLAEQLCVEYSSVFGIHTAVVRPFSVYGPGLKKQLFWDVFGKLHESEGTIELLGTGKESRDYIYIDDLVRGLECVLLTGKMVGEVYNLASGVETSIAEAVELLVKVLKKPTALHFNGIIRPGDPLNWCANIDRIKELGFCPVKSLPDGLTQLASWLHSQAKYNG